MNSSAKNFGGSSKSDGSFMIVIAIVVIIFVAVAGLLIYSATRPKEGDECEGDDDRGTYEIDEDGKCTLISCETGWEVDGKTCIKTVVPDVTPTISTDQVAPVTQVGPATQMGPAPTEAKGKSVYIRSAMYKCGGYPAVDVTTWFKNYIDTTPPGDDLTQYLCSTGGKYSDTCPGGPYPGSHTAFTDSGLYEAAKAAGDPGGSCSNQFHAVFITGVNDFRTVWTWGSHLDLSNILTKTIARSAYIQSAMYKCGGYPGVDVTEWFKNYVNGTTPGSDMTQYLCSTGGKYAGACDGGSYPGSQSAFTDSGLYEAATAAGDPGGTCGSQYHKVTVTGVNGTEATWSWGSYLDLSKIIDGTMPLTGADKTLYDAMVAADVKL